MGISIQVWRARIGTYSQPNKIKASTETLQIGNLSLCIRICLFFLLIAQCVEPNPGPGPKERGSTSRAGSTSKSRGGNSTTSRASQASNEHHINSSQPITYDLRSNALPKTVDSQQSLNSWLLPATGTGSGSQEDLLPTIDNNTSDTHNTESGLGYGALR